MTRQLAVAPPRQLYFSTRRTSAPPRAAAIAVFSVICGLHGFLYGVLYVPVEALAYDLDLKEVVLWLIKGIPFDVLHGVGNLVFGCFVYPLSETVNKIMKKQLNF